MNQTARVFIAFLLIGVAASLIYYPIHKEFIAGESSPDPNGKGVKTEAVLKTDPEPPAPKKDLTPSAKDYSQDSSNTAQDFEVPEGYKEYSPYSDGEQVLNDEGKLNYWNTLERQRETRHDLLQIMEAQDIFADLLARSDSNVFMMQIVMDGLDSLRKDHERANRELMEFDEQLVKYNYYLRKPVILKEE